MGRKRAKIMVVAEDPDLQGRIAKLVGERKIQADRVSSIDRLVERSEIESYEVVVITGIAFKSGDLNSIDLLDVIRAHSPSTQVLFLVEPRDIRIAMSALESGAHRYAKLPVSDEELWFLIDTAIKTSLRSARGRKRHGVRRKDRFEKMVGRSDAMQNVYGLIRHAAASNISVLLLGETGTGKDLAAQAIHTQGVRSKGPYVPVNLGALPRELVASELFGSEKGAFTGATETRVGSFEQANDGTIFLDEIAMMDEKVQVALLRLLERKKFHRLGGRRAISNNARLLAATNHDLLDDIKSGSFRKDLYYRLDVFRIVMPPLRERPSDISLLIDEFLIQYSRAFEKDVREVAPACLRLLEPYHWPGNVRELKNVIQRAVLVCQGHQLLPKHLPPRLRSRQAVRKKITFQVGTPLENVEREMIIGALAACQNNRKRAAEMLGISRRTLYNKLRRHTIE